MSQVPWWTSSAGIGGGSIGLEVTVFLISHFTGIDLTSLLGSSDLTGRAARTTIYLARAVLGSFQR
ncbi:hypothetical protein [Schaalia turicensis]|uniref:hypothetical protein n=1 Tax=Schaalia turicensis TaxID=131111 RepID=UPI001055D321|nr:hypothetical protein [Schaalia turicensis]